MKNGDIYNWAETTDKGYSIGWSLETLIQKGLPSSEPPQTIDELLEQVLRLIKESGEEWAGPISINSLDNYLAPFAEREKPSKQQFVTQMEHFFKEICTGSEVTISLDLIPRPDFDVSENTQVILDAINGVVLDTYRSQLEKGVFEPYIIINLYPETNWESDCLNHWIELSYLFGQPTYQNFISGTISPETLRPRSYTPLEDVTYLRLGGSIGNSENQSVTGYSCINLAKIGSESLSEEEFFELLDMQMDNTVEMLNGKRERVEARFNAGELPITAHFLENLDWSFSVITLVGMNEALETVIDAPLGHVAGKAVTYKVLEYLLRKIERVHESTGRLYSLESYPSETPGSVLLGEYDSDYLYLTAATELKPSHGDDLWDVLEHQKKYHSMYTGGTLQQIHLKEGLTYNEGLKLLVKRALEVFGYNYVAISPVFSLCPEHGYLKGEQDCPICGIETETYTRIDHKISKVSELSTPLKEAYRQRVYYDVKNR